MRYAYQTFRLPVAADVAPIKAGDNNTVRARATSNHEHSVEVAKNKLEELNKLTCNGWRVVFTSRTEQGWDCLLEYAQV